MFEIGALLILIPALPLLAAVTTAVLGPRVLRERSHWPTIVALAGSFVCSGLLVFAVQRGESRTDSSIGFQRTCVLWQWATVTEAYAQNPLPPNDSGGGSVDGGLRDFSVAVTLQADALTALMLVMVTFVSSLVAIYSVGYMHADRGYWRFFAYVSLFVFSMTMLVSVSNFVLLYVFWEAVGACSYLLIGFWYQKEEAAAAGKKAFLVNRVGDFGFALGLFLIWTTYGTLNFHDTDAAAGVLGQARLSGQTGFAGGGTALAICLLLLLGACGKSAQFPLHIWLPDAMEGPTPVSALIHAATMVTAGVYMVARCTPLFIASPDAQLVVAAVGGTTALLAALIALTQFDLKRVLAYSTISQLGYMFLALGTASLAGITAGMFHLFTHAFFKALLFLGAGSVMHAMGGVIDMRRFGGLRRLMPITHWTFAVGCLALAGIFPFAGFWSKDAIVASVHDKVHELAHEIEQRQEHVGAAFPVHVVARGASEVSATVSSQTRAAFKRGTRGSGLQNSILAARHDSMINRLPPRELNSESLTPTPEPLALEKLPATSLLTQAPIVGSRESSAQHSVSTLTDDQLDRSLRVYRWLYVVALVTAFLTAFYTFRAFFMTFYGRQTVPQQAGDHAHESPRSMWIPLSILAAFAFGIGYLLPQNDWLADFLRVTPVLAFDAMRATTQPGTFHVDVAVISTAVAVSGLGLAAFLYLGHRREIDVLTYLMDFRWLEPLAALPWTSRLAQLPPVVLISGAARAVGLAWLARLVGYALLLVLCVLLLPLFVGFYLSPYKLSFRKFYFDEIYSWLFVWPLRVCASLSYAVDRWFIDGLVDLCGRVPVWIGGLLRGLQMGLVPFYGLAMVLGMLTLIAAKALWGGD